MNGVVTVPASPVTPSGNQITISEVSMDRNGVFTKIELKCKFHYDVYIHKKHVRQEVQAIWLFNVHCSEMHTHYRITLLLHCYMYEDEKRSDVINDSFRCDLIIPTWVQLSFCVKCFVCMCFCLYVLYKCSTLNLIHCYHTLLCIIHCLIVMVNHSNCSMKGYSCGTLNGYG